MRALFGRVWWSWLIVGVILELIGWRLDGDVPTFSGVIRKLPRWAVAMLVGILAIHLLAKEEEL